MQYYIIVGEPSGDLHASNLMRELLKEDPEAQFRFWGGDLMTAVGGEMVRHYRDTAVMGVWDVLTHLGKIRNNFKLCRRDIEAHRPDALILVDYPGFNLPMAEWAHKKGIKVLYYISPKVWASKEHRVKKMRRYIDRLYSILPFEIDYFKRKDVSAFYCGNPVMDALEQREHKNESFDDFCARCGLDGRPKIALLPGSRVAELKYNLPEMMKLPKLFPDYQFVIGGAPSFTKDDYKQYLGESDIPVLFGETYQIVSQARAAIVTSGTATLETGLLGCPQVVVYLMWGGGFSDWIAHLFIKVPWISLVNLILGREAVIELFQKKYSFEQMRNELTELTADSPRRKHMLEDYAELRIRVGAAGCSSRAASDMVAYLHQTLNR